MYVHCTDAAALLWSGTGLQHAVHCYGAAHAEPPTYLSMRNSAERLKKKKGGKMANRPKVAVLEGDFAAICDLGLPFSL